MRLRGATAAIYLDELPRRSHPLPRFVPEDGDGWWQGACLWLSAHGGGPDGPSSRGRAREMTVPAPSNLPRAFHRRFDRAAEVVEHDPEA
jgi:hypothetical protein